MPRTAFLALLLLAALAAAASARADSESLDVSVLSESHSLVDMTFRLSLNVVHAEARSFGTFPAWVWDALVETSARSFDVSLTRGRFDEERWGITPTSVIAPMGAELVVHLSNDDDHASLPPAWSHLAQVLGGKLCASLTQLDVRRVRHDEATGAWIGRLPREGLCTENVTPWTASLPCGHAAGLAALVEAHHLLRAPFQLLRMKASREQETVELVIQIALVAQKTREMGTVRDLFPHAKGLVPCTLFERSRVVIDGGGDEDHSLAARGDASVTGDIWDILCCFAQKRADMSRFLISSAVLPNGAAAAAATAHADLFRFADAIHSLVFVAHFLLIRRSVVESNGERLLIVAESLSNATSIVALDQVIPWYLRAYAHSLDIRLNGLPAAPLEVTLDPAMIRGRPGFMHVRATIPPGGRLAVAVEVQRMFLHYTEHPPDANRGFEIECAPLGHLLQGLESDAHFSSSTLSKRPLQATIEDVDGRRVAHRAWSTPLLVYLPLPDFSMPYNVITLTSTALAIFFGYVFNLLTRRFAPVPPRTTRGGLLGFLRKRKAEGASSSSSSSR